MAIFKINFDGICFKEICTKNQLTNICLYKFVKKCWSPKCKCLFIKFQESIKLPFALTIAEPLGGSNDR